MPKAPTFYVDKSVLAERIREYRRTGVLSEALSLDLLNIAKGVHDRFQFSPDRDDFANECFMHLAYQAPLRGVDPEQNPFSYFTRCVYTFGEKRRNKWFKLLRESAEYRAEMAARYGADVLSTEDVGDYGGEHHQPADTDSVYDTEPDPGMHEQPGAYRYDAA